MNVLAVDPGNVQSAYAVWNGSNLLETKIVPNDELLANINKLTTKYGVNIVAIEMVASYGMPVGRTVFDTTVWIGRFYQEAMLSSAMCAVKLVTRAKIKMHLCQSMRAKDGNIRQAIVDRFGDNGTKGNPNPVYEPALPEKLSKDKWAAFAIAIYVADGGEDFYKI